MLGLEYEITQYYTFNDYERIKTIMNLTEAKNYQLDEEYKIIKYTINKMQCVTLSDLLYGIEQNFIKMYIGQFLELFKNLIDYVLKINQLGIEHEYLDMNRIWIVLNDQSEYINIIHSKLFYEIQFTGYECPFYEQYQVEPIPSSEKIKIIIKEIIINFMKKHFFEISDSDYEKIKVDILDILVYQLQQQNLQEIVKSIIELMQTYNYDEKTQRIKIDDNCYYILRTYKNQSKVKKEFQTVVNTHRNNQILLEQIIHQLISSDTNIVDALWYQRPHQQIENITQCLDQNNNAIKQQFEDKIFKNINVQLETQIQLMDKMYRFSFDSQYMALQIKDAIMSSKKLEYFNNSIGHQNKQEFKESLAIQEICHLVKEQVDLEVQILILKLIAQLL